MLDIIQNLPWYLLYFGVDIVMLLVAGWLYVRFTPYDELEMIRQGNAAAAIGLGGVLLGYSFVIYTITVATTSIFPLVVWSFIALAVQVGAFELLRYVVLRDDWKAKMEKGDMAHGIWLGAFSLAVGIINAACLHP